MLDTITIDGLKVAYETSGKGRPLILMHGWGCDHTTVASVAATASATHTVYSLDLPGFGQSDEPAEPWTPRALRSDASLICGAARAGKSRLLRAIPTVAAWR